MKHYRAAILATTMMMAALPLFGCGNSLDGGTGPSGSYMRVTSVSPGVVEADIWADVNKTVAVSIANQAAPNSTTPTNSFVTMNRYRVNFTGVSKSVSIPPINGSGQTVGIAANSSGTMTVLVMDVDTLEYIRSHYDTIGNGESLTLRATITIWGEDVFKLVVQTEAQVTVVVGGKAPELKPVAG